jgi:hypothetical protein
VNANSFRPQELLNALREFTAGLCIAALCLSGGRVAVGQAQQTPAPAEQNVVTLPADQLDSLVAPIALYPDPLLSQTLVASTYPLEVIQLQQWLAKNKGLSEKALADAVEKQDWDPEYSVPGWTARRGEVIGREHQVDNGPRKRFSRATE